MTKTVGGGSFLFGNHFDIVILWSYLGISVHFSGQEWRYFSLLLMCLNVYVYVFCCTDFPICWLTFTTCNHERALCRVFVIHNSFCAHAQQSNYPTAHVQELGVQVLVHEGLRAVRAGEGPLHQQRVLGPGQTTRLHQWVCMHSLLFHWPVLAALWYKSLIVI